MSSVPGATPPTQPTLGCSPLDAAVGGDDPLAHAALLQRATQDLGTALELAEAVEFVARCRDLRVATGIRYDNLLRDVLRRAERRLPPPRRWRPFGVVAAAAAVTFAALTLLDPWLRGAAAPPAAPTNIALALPVARPAAAASAQPHPFAGELEAIRSRLLREQHVRLAAAAEATDDSVGSWLSPRNAVALMQLDHEVRSHRAVRERALTAGGGMVGADARVQEVADQLAGELQRRFAAVPFEPAPSTAELAGTVRALVAAGLHEAPRAAAAARGAAVLRERLAAAHGAELATALAALVELAAATGDGTAAVASAGTRLVDDLVAHDGSGWQRGRPDLLRRSVAAAAVGEAARTMQFLPAFGVDAARCALARRLLVAVLEERLDGPVDGPETFAAVLYGGSDLLDEARREHYRRQLRRWQPTRLAPDYGTVQQWAWSLQPGERGYVQLQWQLRPLATARLPADLTTRATWTLCMATQYAAPCGHLLQQLARGALGE